MSTLTGSSTFSDALDAYKENASWEEDKSVAKAGAFITACKFLIMLMPKSTANDSASATMSVEQLKEEQAQARAFVSNNSASSQNPSYKLFSLQDIKQ